MTTRRGAITGAGALLGAAMLGQAGSVLAAPGPGPRVRVIIDNDFGGDPDGLYQLAHHVLSPDAEIPLIVGSHLHVAEGFTASRQQASDGAADARALLGVLGLAGRHLVLAGAQEGMASRADTKPSPATAAIVREAMREDRTTPLYYAAGAGLTELALAWLAEPRIGKRLRLVWIGGNEHPDLAYPPPGPATAEYNLTIDRIAAQVIFNESDIEIWQVPRDAYRQMLVSAAELDELATQSEVGAWLAARIERVRAMVANAPPPINRGLGETYALGDSPLVTLTALQSSFEPDASSSSYRLLPTPVLNDDGSYEARPGGRMMRVYTRIDTRLTFADMAAKFRKTAPR